MTKWTGGKASSNGDQTVQAPGNTGKSPSSPTEPLLSLCRRVRRGAANLRARHTAPPCAASCLPTPCPAHAQRRLNITPVCPHGHKLDRRSHPRHRSPLARPRERLGAQHVPLAPGEEAYLSSEPAILHTETRHPAHRTLGGNSSARRLCPCKSTVTLSLGKHYPAITRPRCSFILQLSESWREEEGRGGGEGSSNMTSAPRLRKAAASVCLFYPDPRVCFSLIPERGRKTE